MTMSVILLHAAVILISAALIPQAMRVLKEGTRSISSYSYWLTALGLLGFMVYGFYVQSLTLTIASAIGLSLASVVLACKMRNKDKN